MKFLALWALKVTGILQGLWLLRGFPIPIPSALLAALKVIWVE